MADKLILRAKHSPYTGVFSDITLGSTLSHENVDDNFIYLKGNIIHNAIINNTDLILQLINGGEITVDLSSIVPPPTSDIFVTGVTFDNNLNELKLYRNDNVELDVSLSGLTINPSSLLGYYLPLSGGTMYGDILLNNSSIRYHTNTNPLSVQIGYEAGLMTGSTNNHTISIGAEATKYANNPYQTIDIGYQANYASENNSNSINIGANTSRESKGSQNIFLGQYAGYESEKPNSWGGGNNIGIGGYGALFKNLGNYTIGIGYMAGFENNSQNSVGIGSFSLYSNTGDYASGLGYNSLYNNTGDYSVGVGYSSLSDNTGNYSVGVGYSTLSNNTKNNAIGIGYSSGGYNTGDNLISIGFLSSGNNTGDNLISIGGSSGNNNTGDNNTFIGYNVGRNNNGNENTNIGYEAGSKYIGATTTQWKTNSENSIFLGNLSKSFSSTATTNEIVIGYDAEGNGNNTVTLGNDMINHSYLKGVVNLNALGSNASVMHLGIDSNGDIVSASTNTSLEYLPLSGGTMYGDILLENPVTISAISSSGTNTTQIGLFAGANNTGNYQVALGSFAGMGNIGEYQVALGNASANNNSGINQVALGNNTGNNNSANNQIAFGYFSGSYNSGINQVAIGNGAGGGNSGGNQIAIGNSSGGGNSGGNQIAIGNGAGGGNNIDNAIYIGNGAGGGNGFSGTYSNIIVIGNGAGNGLNGSDVISIGRNTQQGVTANNAIAIGTGARASNNSITLLSNGTQSPASGSENILIGSNLGLSTIVSNNILIGSNIIGGPSSSNIVLGNNAPYTSNSNNIRLGDYSGYYLLDGTTSNMNIKDSIYIGSNIISGNLQNLTTNENEIVIGANAEGNGANTITIGSTFITNTYLKGIINLNTLGTGTAIYNLGVDSGGNIVEANSSSTIISTTLTDVLILISNEELITGALYEIKGVDSNLYGDTDGESGTTIYLHALSENVLSPDGWGVFYTPMYDTNLLTKGIYTENIMYGYLMNLTDNFEFEELVITDTGAEGYYICDNIIRYESGDWTNSSFITGLTTNSVAEIDNSQDFTFTTPSFQINDTIIYGGKLWNNIQGNLGYKEDEYTLNSDDWEMVEDYKSFYNLQVDKITYNINTDKIIYRADNQNNHVYSTNDTNNSGIKSFQWGLPRFGPNGVYGNHFRGHQLQMINTLCYVYSNTKETIGGFNINNPTLANTVFRGNDIKSGSFGLTHGFQTMVENNICYNLNLLFTKAFNSNIIGNNFMGQFALTLYNCYVVNNIGAISTQSFNTIRNKQLNGIAGLGGSLEDLDNNGTLMFESMTKELIRIQGGASKLRYTDNTGAITIADIND